MKDVQFSMSKDKTRIAIYVGEILAENDDPVILDVPALDIMISNLGKLRSQMSEPIVKRLDPNPVFSDVTREPVFHVNRQHVVSKEIIVAARHEGFGWLAFVVSNAAAIALSDMIRNQANAGKPSIIIPGRDM